MPRKNPYATVNTIIIIVAIIAIALVLILAACPVPPT